MKLKETSPFLKKFVMFDYIFLRRKQKTVSFEKCIRFFFIEGLIHLIIQTRHSLLRLHAEKENFYKRNVYRKDIEQAYMITRRNNCEEKTNLTSENRLDNIDWCKCGCECKPTGKFAVNRDTNKIPDENFKDT